jgi:hypothetical protein
MMGFYFYLFQNLRNENDFRNVAASYKGLPEDPLVLKMLVLKLYCKKKSNEILLLKYIGRLINTLIHMYVHDISSV